MVPSVWEREYFGGADICGKGASWGRRVRICICHSTLLRGATLARISHHATTARPRAVGAPLRPLLAPAAPPCPPR